MKISILFFLSVFPFFAVSNIQDNAFELEPQLKENFLNLLGKAKDFHKVIEKGDKKATQEEIHKTQSLIKELYPQALSLPHSQQRIHSHKLLKSMEEQLAFMKFQEKSSPENKKKHIKKLFNSFFEMAQVYNLKKDMKDQIFYCSKDKSTWFQSGNKPKNPISPHYKNCGRRVF